MSDETSEERQDNELTALQAIFGDAVVDNRENIAWKVWRPLDLLLTLHPLHNSDVQGIHCSVTLHFKCCMNYPDKPPSILINKINGISDDNATKLLSELVAMAEGLTGEVMIFQLAQHAQQFLHDHNKPTLSFYEEMVLQKNEMEKLKLHDIQTKENEEREKIKEEIQKQQEKLRSAGRRQRLSISQDPPDQDVGDAPELICYADNEPPAERWARSRTSVPCTCSARCALVLRVAQRNNKKVYISGCLGHSSTGATTYLAIEDDTGKRLIAKKWSLPPASDFMTRSRQLTALHEDFQTLCRLKHSLLVPYTALETTKEPAKRTVKQCVYIFRDYVPGTSLKNFKEKVHKFSDKFDTLKLLRHVSSGVFSALSTLHNANVLHRDLRCENVYLDNDSAVRLVGAGLDTRLSEMYDGDSYCDRQTKSADIYAAAQLLLSIVSRQTPTGIPPDLPSGAKDFFARCLTDDEQSQWSAERLSRHPFLVDAPAAMPNGTGTRDDGSGSEEQDPSKLQNPILATNSHSRLYDEFEVLTWLGKGAFGDVLKVKNKLDLCFYAIKRVQLNPETAAMNYKITREVKLLSGLNHENVVRYYNAWIETTAAVSGEEDATSVSDIDIVKTPTPKAKPNQKQTLEEIVAKLGQNLNWSMEKSGARRVSVGAGSDSDEEAGPGYWERYSSDSDESIQFAKDSTLSLSNTLPSEDVTDAPLPKSTKTLQVSEVKSEKSVPNKPAVLFIQMEFCEKHTLRQAIDNGLNKEQFRAWRLFREIVEGLAHVHQKGMIHRDLKPVNIFLDSNDHVKIGDFGLATTTMAGILGDERNKNPEEIGGSLTGQVGTALYVAPELLQSAGKVIYNQKVDIYSLGVIVFEMFHPPLSTGMERMKVLSSLRTKDIVMPEDFETEDNAKQIHVIRWLLDHDASIRPSCAELLASEHVPRSVPESALSGLLSHTLSDKKARGYQRLVDACLTQRQSVAEDLIYTRDMKVKPMAVLTQIKDAIVKVFRSHGAWEFAPPLLTPRAAAWERSAHAAKLMTAAGTVCHLPHDLRLPFARYIAYNGTRHMRRYVVDRVFREARVKGYHPKEILECAFDIVTPVCPSLWLDAELLVAAVRAAAAASQKVAVQFNHTQLLANLLEACGVPLDKHADIYPVLVDVSFGRITRFQLQTHLTSLCISESDIKTLTRLMESEVPVYEARELLQPVLRGRFSRPIHDSLETVYRNAVALGCECPMTVSPCLAYNATQHSGVFWQMAVQRERAPSAKRPASHVIAAGGRYDALVSQFSKVPPMDGFDGPPAAAGFSMSLERIAALAKAAENGGMRCDESTLICISMPGPAGSGRVGVAATKKANLVRDLWAAGYICCPWVGSLSDAFDINRAALVLLNDEREPCVRVACWGNNRVREHKVPYIDVIDFIKQKLSPEMVRTPEGSTTRQVTWGDMDKSNTPNTSITFVTRQSEKFSKNNKKNCENQIATQLSAQLSALGLCWGAGAARVRVHCVAVGARAAPLRLLLAQWTAPLNHEELMPAARVVFDQYPKEQKMLDEAVVELTNIVKQNNQNRSTDETQLYALYSIPDSLCKLIT